MAQAAHDPCRTVRPPTEWHRSQLAASAPIRRSASSDGRAGRRRPTPGPGRGQSRRRAGGAATRRPPGRRRDPRRSRRREVGRGGDPPGGVGGFAVGVDGEQSSTTAGRRARGRPAPGAGAARARPTPSEGAGEPPATEEERERVEEDHGEHRGKGQVAHHADDVLGLFELPRFEDLDPRRPRFDQVAEAFHPEFRRQPFAAEQVGDPAQRRGQVDRDAAFACGFFFVEHPQERRVAAAVRGRPDRAGTAASPSPVRPARRRCVAAAASPARRFRLRRRRAAGIRFLRPAFRRGRRRPGGGPPCSSAVRPLTDDQLPVSSSCWLAQIAKIASTPARTARTRATADLPIGPGYCGGRSRRAGGGRRGRCATRRSTCGRSTVRRPAMPLTILVTSVMSTSSRTSPAAWARFSSGSAAS